MPTTLHIAGCIGMGLGQAEEHYSVKVCRQWTMLLLWFLAIGRCCVSTLASAQLLPAPRLPFYDHNSATLHLLQLRLLPALQYSCIAIQGRRRIREENSSTKDASEGLVAHLWLQ